MDLNPRINTGWTPLTSALNYGHIQVAQRLVDAGADVILKGPRGASPMHYAARAGDLDLVKSLHQKGAKINGTVDDGMTRFQNSMVPGSTPLIEAAMYGRTAVVAYLLEQGADPTPLNGKNRSALDLAQHYRHAEVVALLSAALARDQK